MNIKNTSLFRFKNAKTDPIPTEALLNFHIGMTWVWYAICIAGICTNFFNLKTFTAMGLLDSVTLSFFCLAISDLNFCGIALVEMMAFLFHVLQRVYGWHFYLPSLTPTFYMMCVRKVFNMTTILITTFLAVQRCLCVVIPFHVKGMFTRTRTIVFMVVILIFSATISALYIWRHKIVVGTNHALNESELQVFVMPDSDAYLFMMEVFLGTSLNLSCQILVVICLVTMGIALRKSSEFRKSTMTVRITTTANAKTRGEDPASQSKSAPRSKERTKESQALIQVSLVSVIFVITNSPHLCSGLAHALIPEFGLYHPYHNLFHLAHNLMFTMELLNSSINLVVYYRCNTKFRKCFPIKIGAQGKEKEPCNS